MDQILGGNQPVALLEGDQDRAGGVARGPFWQIAKAVRSNRKAMVGVCVLSVFVVAAIIPNVIAPYSPDAEIFTPSAAASWAHLLGTTAYGQDVFSQLVWGTGQSLEIGFFVGALATLVSVLIGIGSAYIGGLTDAGLSFVTDIFLVIPTFPLIVVLAAYDRNGGTALMVAVLTVTGWAYGARVLRAQALSLRTRDFLEAARARGEGTWHVIVAEMLPNMTSLIVANFLGAAVYGILAAAGLQFVGLGDTASWSWGTMLYWSENSTALQSGSPLWALMPGLCIAMVGGSLSLLNYAFDEISNPALRMRTVRARRRGQPVKGAPSGSRGER